MAREAASATPLHDAALVDAPPQLPEGEYLASYLYHETAYIFRTPKVFIHFQIYGGQYHGTRLYSAYRVRDIRGKPRKGGAIRLHHTHELYRQFVALSGYRERPDRISLHRLKGTLLRVQIRTVKQDANQRELVPALQYSVIDRMLGLEAGQP